MKINNNTGRTINSWMKCCKQKIIRHMNIYGFKVALNISVADSRDKQLWKFVFHNNEEGVEHWVSIDKSCLDDDTGSNSTLEKLNDAILNKKMTVTQWLEHDTNYSYGVIGSCIEKSSSVFDFLVEYGNIKESSGAGSHPTRNIFYRTAGVYGDALITGMSERDILEKLESETIKLFS
jgi:hypothetical protein